MWRRHADLLRGGRGRSRVRRSHHLRPTRSCSTARATSRGSSDLIQAVRYRHAQAIDASVRIHHSRHPVTGIVFRGCRRQPGSLTTFRIHPITASAATSTAVIITATATARTARHTGPSLASNQMPTRVDGSEFHALGTCLKQFKTASAMPYGSGSGPSMWLPWLWRNYIEISEEYKKNFHEPPWLFVESSRVKEAALRQSR